MEQAINVVVRLCHRRPFRSMLFPKACLRQSLLLYHTLTYLGFLVEFHVGVRKKGEELIAHSWVTFSGKPVADKTSTDSLKIVYSYPNKSNLHLVPNGGHYGREKTTAAGSGGESELPAPCKQQWQEPKLTFVKPKLIKHGEFKEVTGFFGQFTPQ